MAADHITTPKNLYPALPAAIRNTDAAGLDAVSLFPAQTTPNAARNNTYLIIAVMQIPVTELRFTCGIEDLPFMFASSKRCAPAKLIYPPTVPPTNATIIGKSTFSGQKVFFIAFK